MGEPTRKGKFKSEDITRADGENMTENRKMTLEEATDRFVGKPYDYEAEKALTSSGFIPLLYGRNVAMIRPIRKCARFNKK